MYSRAKVRRQSGDYQSAIPALLSRWDPTLSGELSADVEDATRALQEFDSYATNKVGKDHQGVGPMAAILLRTESASSSQIENLTTSARHLALAESDQNSTANSILLVGNVRAMQAALELSTHIDQAAILTMHRHLLEGQRSLRDHAGVWRTQQVWIGAEAAGPLGADFVAPQPQRVPSCIDDLLRFIDRDDLPVVLQVALAHAQFETIHPFVDGNGRTGRALAAAMLRNKGLVTRTTVPLSAGILANSSAYFEALAAFRAGDAAPIVETFAQAARFAAHSGAELIDKLLVQVERAKAQLAGVRSHALAWQLLPVLIEQPVVNTAYLMSRLGINEVSAARTVELLTQRGILTECTGLRRNRVWQQNEILAVFDDYAASLRRIGQGQ